jgi:EAL domain-containing protein (putative c-di-GMP-specific phosphodiesterase class I)
VDDLVDDPCPALTLPRPGSVRRLDAEQRLRRAIELDQIEVWFQPQIRLCTGDVVGYEALARWRDPERGVLGPDRFIPLAEETGEIVALGQLLLERACRELVELDRRADGTHGPTPWVAVNLSGRQLTHLGLAEQVAEVLARTGLAPHRLWLEITETALMDDLELGIRTLYQLRAMGVHLSIDDFGTGWSTLSHVKRFPVEQLKIDRTFTAGVGRDADDTTIVTSIIALAHALGMHVVAEGVETREQLDALVGLGCDVGQGWFWDRALPPHDVVITGLPRHVTEPRHAHFDHTVELYGSDELFVQSICRTLAAPLRAGDAVVAIVSAEHCALMEAALRAAGIDLATACADGRFTALDMADTALEVLVNGRPDEARFEALATDLITRASAGGRRVVVFGEMVALLCAIGNTDAAVDVERMWNRLADRLTFRLICAYPIAQFDDGDPAAAFRDICRLHASVVPNDFYADADEAERALTTALLQQEARAGVIARERLDRRLAELEAELASLRRLLTRPRTGRM